MAGLSGTGKSFLANALAARLGAVVISSDVVRKRLVGVEPTERHVEPWQRGIYAPELTERTYEAMLAEAGPHLERGRPVILDATFMLRRHREAAAGPGPSAGRSLPGRGVPGGGIGGPRAAGAPAR